MHIVYIHYVWQYCNHLYHSAAKHEEVSDEPGCSSDLGSGLVDNGKDTA